MWKNDWIAIGFCFNPNRLVIKLIDLQVQKEFFVKVWISSGVWIYWKPVNERISESGDFTEVLYNVDRVMGKVMSKNKDRYCWWIIIPDYLMTGWHAIRNISLWLNGPCVLLWSYAKRKQLFMMNAWINIYSR